MLFLISLLLAGGVSARAAGLAIGEVLFHGYEDGPPAPSGQPYRPGETVYLSFRITGYATTAEDPKVSLDYEVSAADPMGRPLGKTRTGKIEAELLPEDKEWRPKVRYQVQVPPSPEPGSYTLTLVVRDNSSGSKVRSTVPFLVESPRVESAALAILDFGFYRGEDSRVPMRAQDAFRPGDEAWIRFDISGYKFGPKNRRYVRYGMSLRAPGGKLLFEKPVAATDEGEADYPKLRTSAAFSIRLDPKLEPGDYALLVAVEDGIGGQRAEANQILRVGK